MKQVAVQPSVQYKQLETKDLIKKTISDQKKKKKNYCEELMEEGSNREP